MDRLLFLAVVASLPVMQPPLLSLDGYPLVLTDLLFVILATVVGGLLLLGRMRIAWTHFHSATVAFTLAEFLSAASVGTPHAFIKAAGSGYLGALGILASHYAQQRGVTRQIFWAWAAGSAITVIAVAAGMVLFAAGDRTNPFLYSYGSLIPGAYPRVQGLFVNANVLFTYVAASVFFVIAAIRSRVLSTPVGYSVCAALLVGAVFSLSPGLGGLTLALAWWWAPSLGPRAAAVVRAGGIGAALVFVVATLFSPTMLQRSGSLTAIPIEPSSRVLAWRDAAATFLANPWLGAGPGSDVAHVSYLNASNFQEFLTDAHNTFLSVLGQTGLVGFVCFLWVIVPLIVRMRTRPDLTPRGAWRSACECALVAAVLYPSLSGSFEDTRHVWIVLGLLHAAQSGASDLETAPAVPA